LTYAFKDKNGAVELYKRGPIIVVILSGACGTDVINYYAKKLKKLAQTFHGQPWAYLCNGKDFQAATPEAQQIIVEAYNSSHKLGCHFEAYCSDSYVGKAQTQQIMRDCGNPTDIEQVLFENVQLAETFLLKKLRQLNDKSQDTANTSPNQVG
jgi:hypothetical protein